MYDKGAGLWPIGLDIPEKEAFELLISREIGPLLSVS